MLKFLAVESFLIYWTGVLKPVKCSLIKLGNIHMVKYYYENVLSNQNLTATINITWVTDITTLRVFRDQKAYVFLCIDIHTNYIVASLIRTQVITSQRIF